MEFRLLDIIQQMRCPFLDFLMPIVSWLGNNGFIWIVLTIVMLIIPKTRKTGLTLAIALILNGIICNLIIKPLVGRTRPFDIMQEIELLIKAPLDYSFPSGHTSASFSVAFALIFLKEKVLAIISVVFSILMAFSRLYLYVHYPTDILGGVVAGLMCGFAGYYIVKKIYEARDLKREHLEN